MIVNTCKLLIRCLGLIYFGFTCVYASSEVVDHQIQVRLMPQQQSIQVTDRISLSSDRPFEFTLHEGFQPQIQSASSKLVRTGQYSGDVKLEAYRIVPAQGQKEVVLSYGGKIAYEFSSRTESPGREQKLLSGTISEQGVFLDGGVAWYPVIRDALVTFTLSVQLPAGWSAVSQGAGPDRLSQPGENSVSWVSENPQDDIYLIAGQYHYYADDQPEQRVQSQVFLRQPDKKLAQRYLEVTRYYLDLYENLIGSYPYKKFALVENFWETGYGMPSFTLLGPRVIRLPFILHSSYPHESLHNWWGNGVLVNFEQGNWSEGLTAYLADHLIRERQGAGVQHRRLALQRYVSFVRSDNDFPLREFRTRHSGSSQSIGYDKAMMFFHMLRKKLGDAAFIEGLRYFYSQNLFRTAGFDELQVAFEQVSGKDLSNFFKQWLERVGAPELELGELQVNSLDSGYRIEGQIIQSQSGPVFALDVPVHVYMQEKTEVKRETILMHNKAQTFSIDLPRKPVRIDIDPWFDLFRQLGSLEAPAALSNLFGSDEMLFVLPSKDSDALLSGYEKMVSQWAGGYGKVVIKMDDELKELPQDRPLWILGWNNKFAQAFQRDFSPQQFSLQENELQLSGQVLDINRHSLVLTKRNQRGQVQGWVATGRPKALDGLARKLPHYGKYSYLAFQGDHPAIEYKGEWPVARSPLKVELFEGAEVTGELSPEALWPLESGVQDEQ